MAGSWLLRQIIRKGGAGSGRPSGRWLICLGTAAALLGVIVLAVPGLFVQNAKAYTKDYAYDGFDTCEAPSESNMQTWFFSSPYYYIGIYIGGEERSCSNTDLTESWINDVNTQGWAFLPIWVGLQDPCAGYSHSFPTGDNSTDESDGETAANNATTAAENLGFGSGAVIYYDLEAYEPASDACRTAANWFIHGWDQQLASDGYTPAVYGSSSGSDLSNLWGLSYNPDDVWYGESVGNTVWGSEYIPNSYWPDDHRLSQYKAQHNETWPSSGGVTLSIDTDCALGPVDKAISSLGEDNLFDTGSTNEANGSSEDAECQSG